ncbi:MAG: DUF4384 domain-containing protein [Blastocatellia bacterium]|nr:DUF4384 domain-containing protein [Blastocatellia bacterium]
MRVWIGLLLMAFAFALAPGNAGAQDGSAKDFFYAEDGPQRARQRARVAPRPGAMVKIELKRDGKVRWVSPGTRFYSGDKVRLHIRLNRSGYLTVLNLGSSGRIQRLYPSSLEMASRPVGTTMDFTIPTAPGLWLEFDERPGAERLQIVLSAKPLPEVMASFGANESGAAVASASSEEEVVDVLNSKAFRGVLEEASKDFTISSEDTSTEGAVAVFVVSTGGNANLRKPIVYNLALRHGA